MNLVFLFQAYLLLLLVGLAALPLARRALRRMPGGAYAGAKYLGLLPGLLLLWLARLAGLETSGFFRAWLALGLGFLPIWAFELIKRRSRSSFEGLLSRENLIAELVFLLLLLYFFWGIHFNPEIDPDSERFMDFALLQAATTGSGFPPQDPWFAGEPIHYYYFGYYWVGFLQGLLGKGPVQAFVPSISLLFALFGLFVFAAGRALRGKTLDGFLTLTLVLFSGNLKSFLVVLHSGSLADFDWFGLTRIIPGTINEFPYFSFLWGDLHPYVIAFPLLGFLLLLVLEAGRRGIAGPGDPLAWTLAVSLGLSACVNSWDFPVYALLLLVILYFHERKEAVENRSEEMPARRRVFLRALRQTGAICAFGLVLFLPYLLQFQSAGRSLALVDERTSWTNHLEIHGVHWLVFVSFILISVLRAGYLRARFWLAAFLILIQILLVPGLLLLGLLELALILWLLAERIRDGDAAMFGLVLGLVGLVLAALVEIFYVDDLFGGEIERIVTVFKVYLHTWILFGIASAFLLIALPNDWGRTVRILRAGLIVVALAVGFAYPVAGTRARVLSLGNARSHSSAEHLVRRLGYEHDVIDWLSENAEPGEVVLEAPGGPYTWNGRIAALTSLSTPLAWDAHQATWRNSWEEVHARRNDVDRAFQTIDLDEARGLLDKYGVRYVMIGRLEREAYSKEGLQKFRELGEIVFGRTDVELIRLDPYRTEGGALDREGVTPGGGEDEPERAE